MKKSSQPLKVGVLAVTLALLPLLGQDAKRAAGPTSTRPAQIGIWKSETTGKEYRVRIERDRVYAEWVNPPRDFVRHGAYIRSELRRVGWKWVGTSRSVLPCTMGEGASEHIAKWCPLLTRFEIESMTADRITGRGESMRRFDCQSCKLLETGWADFVWVPRGKVRGTKAAATTASGQK